MKLTNAVTSLKSNSYSVSFKEVLLDNSTDTYTVVTAKNQLGALTSTITFCNYKELDCIRHICHYFNDDLLDEDKEVDYFTATYHKTLNSAFKLVRNY